MNNISKQKKRYFNIIYTDSETENQYEVLVKASNSSEAKIKAMDYAHKSDQDFFITAQGKIYMRIIDCDRVTFH